MTKISVTKELIDVGKRGECKSCPIALAIQPHVRPEVAAGVERTFVDFVTIGQEYTWCLLPDTARAFVTAFDNSKPCGPFEFELDIPEWALREVVWANLTWN